MKLTVVGCSGSFPGPESPASCYLIEHEDTRILLDMGNGSLGALQRYTDIYSIDAVVLSHLHVDHFIDLCSYYVALQYRPDGPADSVAVWGPTDTAARLATAYGLGANTEISGLDVRQIQRNMTVGPFRISTAPMRHPVEARAIRVEAGGHSITYSGDTGPTARLTELAQSSDLALFEASFITRHDNPPDLHLTGRDAARIAVDAECRSLILTHLVPWNDQQEVLEEARQIYPTAELASPGMTFEL